MLALQQRFGFGFVLDPFDAERNANTIGGGAAEVGVELHGCYLIVVTSVSTPSTPPSILSPGFNAATPAGVPVKIRSPGASSNKVDNSAMTSGTLQIRSARSPCWRSSPFTLNQIRPCCGWPIRLAG